MEILGFKGRKIILLGGGGHAISLLEMVKNKSIFKGYSDLSVREGIPIPYLGKDEVVIKHYQPNEYEILLGCVGKPGFGIRSQLLERYKNYTAPVLIAGSAVVTSSSRLGEGTVVFERALVNHAIVERHCVVNSGAIVEHHCHLEDNVFVGPGAILGGEVYVEKNVFIGSGAIVRNGITIKANAVIGMGSVVTKDIREVGIYYGNPARRIIV